MKLTGIIFDWAGTLADFGSCAPVAAMREVFEAAGVSITAAEARRPMGLAKRAHIESLLKEPRIRGEWAKVYGNQPTETDVDKLYEDFRPKQLAALKNYSELIPGVSDAIER